MKLLFVLPRTPWPPYAGQARLAFHRAKELKKLGFDVSLFAFGKSLPFDIVYSGLTSSFAYHKIYLYSFGVLDHALAIFWSLYSWFFRCIPLVSLIYTPPNVKARFDRFIELNDFDIIHFYSINSYPLWGLTSTPYVIDFVDSMSLNLNKRASSVPHLFRFLFNKEFACINRFESCIPITSSCFAILSVSQRDLGFFSLGNAKLDATETIFQAHNIGVELHDYTAPAIDTTKPIKILFFGSLYYYPNVEAVVWFVENVCPLLQRKVDFVFLIAGSRPDSALVDLSIKYDFIQLAANPLNMNNLISSCDLTVAPMQSGSGQQFKVLESLASSTPVVTTSLASEPLGLVNDKHLLVADDPHTFSESIFSLVTDQLLCKQLTRCGWEYVSERFSWRVKAENLASLYSSILSPE